MKLAMAMNSVFGEEESQRQRQIRTQRGYEERVKFRAKIFHQCRTGVRRLAVFAFGAALVVYFVANSGRFQNYSNQLGQKIAARVNAHSAVKQSALQYQDEVDQIAK